jgi:hypothetical protein
VPAVYFAALRMFSIRPRNQCAGCLVCQVGIRTASTAGKSIPCVAR